MFWEESQTKILRDKLNFRRKVKISYRQEYDTHKGSRAVGRKEMTYLSHFQNYSLMTRTASINSQDLIQVVYNPRFSLISSFKHLFVWCQRSTKKKSHFKPSNSHQSFLPTWKSRTPQKLLVSFLFPDGRLHTQSAQSAHSGSPSSVRDLHRLSDLCWLCALNYHWQDPVPQLPAVFLACAFTSLSIVKHTMTDFNIAYVPVMIIRGDMSF